LLRIPYLLAEGRKKENFGKYGRLKRFVNPLLLITGRILNKNTFKLLLKMDGLLCGKTGKYSQLLFIITKNPSYCLFDKPPGVSIDSILDFTVPLHYIKQPI